VEAELRLQDGSVALGQAPAGASTGSGEARELRDGGTWLEGHDVQSALRSIREVLAPSLIGRQASDQLGIDEQLKHADPFADKRTVGANATLALSLACAKAAAQSLGVPLYAHLATLGPPALQEQAAGPAHKDSRGHGASKPDQRSTAQTSPKRALLLPLPQIQIFGGGAHAAGSVDIQDFMVTCPGACSAAQALEWTARIYMAAGAAMKHRGIYHGVADEGGWWPAFKSNEEGIETLLRSIEAAGLQPGSEVCIALDVAATQLKAAGGYQLAHEGRTLDRDGMIAMLLRWVDRYPIVSLEDPLDENDAVGFVQITRALQGKVQVVGDDFLVTDAARIRQAHALGAANAVLLKPNQRGTVSETLQAWRQALNLGYGGIVSARSGETEDHSIVHMALGWSVPQLKVGSFARGERMVKWNELLRLEDSAGEDHRFAGWQAFAHAGITAGSGRLERRPD
jgi:enolase